MIVFINSHGNLTKTNAGFANNRNFKKRGGTVKFQFQE